MRHLIILEVLEHRRQQPGVKERVEALGTDKASSGCRPQAGLLAAP